MKTLKLDLWPKQREVLREPCQEILFGGAAGGGKSHLARVISIVLCSAIPGFQMYLFRRTRPDLYLSHYTGPNSFKGILADPIDQGDVQVADLEVRFSNGSRIHGCHCQYEDDVFKYKSSEMHGRILEEATEFTPFQLQYISTRARFPKDLPVPKHLLPFLPFALYPTNPGGPSHDYLMDIFRVWDWLEGSRVGNPSPVFTDEHKRTRRFVPSKLTDNPSIDPELYIPSITQLRNPEMVRALLDGDWSVKLGALLPELTEAKHQVPHFDPPPHWTRRRSFDWGSSSPAAVVWAAIADGETGGLPRGAVYIYKEWLVAHAEDPTKGIGFSNEQLAKGMFSREDGHNIPYLTDSLPFQARGGVPMWKEFLDHGIQLAKADVSSKEVSVQAVRSLAIGQEGEPMIYFSDKCPHTLRTLQALMPHKNNPEKPADHPEDHIPDCVFHIARDWVHISDRPVTDSEQVQKELTRTDTLKDVVGEFWSQLD